MRGRGARGEAAVSARGLEEALLAIGIAARVEARDALAVLVPTGDVGPLVDASARRRAAALAREHGFSHLALELLGAPEGRDDGAPVHRD